MSASGATRQRALGYEQPINALVCGASTGIGLALVDALLGMPQVALVMAASRSAIASPALATRAQRWPERLLTCDLDIRDETSLAEASRRIGEQVGALQLTINCIGALHNGPSLQPEKRLADVTREALLESFSVNACGAVLLLKHLQPLLPTRERAVITSLTPDDTGSFIAWDGQPIAW